MLPVLRLAAGVCALSMPAALHAATPISLPIGDIGLHADDDLELPVPPPPRASKPDVSQMRLVIKQQPIRTGCASEDERRQLNERRHVTVQPAPWLTKPALSPLG